MLKNRGNLKPKKYEKMALDNGSSNGDNNIDSMMTPKPKSKKQKGALRRLFRRKRKNAKETPPIVTPISSLSSSDINSLPSPVPPTDPSKNENKSSQVIDTVDLGTLLSELTDKDENLSENDEQSTFSIESSNSSNSQSSSSSGDDEEDDDDDDYDRDGDNDDDNDNSYNNDDDGSSLGSKSTLDDFYQLVTTCNQPKSTFAMIDDTSTIGSMSDTDEPKTRKSRGLKKHRKSSSRDNGEIQCCSTESISQDEDDSDMFSFISSFCSPKSKSSSVIS
jgi:hypothetical protein